ncbi:MAG: PD40 domain-containing protein [Chloroflexi bacterium]|nr:PD40 domain-containing protein [Chloroflexota bacterium]
MGTPGSVYVVTYGEKEGVKVSGKVPRILSIVPAWSPDGKELAFAGVEDLNGDGQFSKEEAGIYVCNVEKGGVRRVATVYPVGWHLRWSPTDPFLILQIGKANVPVPVAHVLDLTNGQLIAKDDATISACWSPNGQFIAVYSIADRKIHILNKTGSEEYAIKAPGGVVVDMQWLPAKEAASAEDKGYLLVTSAQDPRSSSGKLYLRSASASGAESWLSLTAPNPEVSAAYPAVSPDGRYLAYTLMVTHANPRGGAPVLDADLYVLELGKDEPRRLTTDPGFEGFPTWIPVGK